MGEILGIGCSHGPSLQFVDEQMANVLRRTIASERCPVCCHTVPATGITAYLSNGGTQEKAQPIAAHESPKATKLYDRIRDSITLGEAA